MNTSPAADAAVLSKKDAIIAVTKIVAVRIVLPVALTAAAIVIAKKLDA